LIDWELARLTALYTSSALAKELEEMQGVDFSTWFTKRNTHFGMAAVNQGDAKLVPVLPSQDVFV
jgi:hypothetical protein